MAKHTITGFITAEPITYGADKGKLLVDFRTYKPSTEYEPRRVVVREHSIEVEVPDNFDTRPGTIANLEALRESETNKYRARVKEINDRISSMLAIENCCFEVSA